jgi:chaperonin GroEL
LIATTMDKVGKDGVITIEDSNSMNLEIEYVEGMQFDKGYISSYFVTNNASSTNNASAIMDAILDEPYILLYDKKISSADSLVPLLEKLIVSDSRALVTIAEDVVGQALPHWY